MYWLAGLNLCNLGKIYSFELNKIWHQIAQANFQTASVQHALTIDKPVNMMGFTTENVNIALIKVICIRNFVNKLVLACFQCCERMLACVVR